MRPEQEEALEIILDDHDLPLILRTLAEMCRARATSPHRVLPWRAREQVLNDAIKKLAWED